MALTVGSRLGHYDVTALIGEGGIDQAAPIHVVAARPRDAGRGGTRVRRLGVPLALSLLVFPVAHAQVPEAYDIVLRGGRVMDPETGLDAVRNVGIRGDRIVEISERGLRGDDVIDVSGLVVAPGFIDLHAHGQTNEANEYQAHDGVTTALELESGRLFVAEWLQSRTGDSILNFGTTVSHRGSRWQVMAQYANLVSEVEDLIGSEGLTNEIRRRLRGETRDERWTPSTGQLINVAKWNLLRYIPVKMRGAEDDKEETAQSCASV